jgi:hypothetical protein
VIRAPDCRGSAPSRGALDCAEELRTAPPLQAVRDRPPLQPRANQLRPSYHSVLDRRDPGDGEVPTVIGMHSAAHPPAKPDRVELCM